MSFWEKNSLILKQRYSGLLEQLNSNNDDLPFKIEIETAKSGDPVIKANGLYIHSPRDPAREGQKLSQTEEDVPVIILGFGLGYAAQNAAIRAAKNNNAVIIVEKHIKLLRLAFETRDLSDFLLSKNIIFVAGGTGDGIKSVLSLIRNNNENDKPPVIIRNRTIMDLDIEWYKNIEDKIYSFSMKDKVNTATLKRFGRRWVRNISRNMTFIRDYPGILRLENLCETGKNKLPVFMAAAGPGLDNIKPFLNEIHSRCIIVAVDTNLRFFTQNGIQPDFVVTCDPQFWNSRHFDRCDCQNTSLIAESAVYPPVFQLPFKRKFLYGSMYPLSYFMEEKIDSKGRLAAGGSVATAAWDFARFLGAENIWISGLDLSFPEYKTHFRGARFEEKANSEMNRFAPAETWVVRALRDGSSFKTKSCTGGQVLTDRRLSLYAAWFEDKFSQNKHIKNFSLLHNGLAINGLKAADTGEFLNMPVMRDEINLRLKYIYAKTDNDFFNDKEICERKSRFKNAFSSLVKELESVKKAAEEGDALVSRCLENIDSGQLSRVRKENAIKELDRITQKIQKSEVKETASFLFPIESEKEILDKDPFRTYLMSSQKLFKTLSESADYHLECLSE